MQQPLSTYINLLFRDYTLFSFVQISVTNAKFISLLPLLVVLHMMLFYEFSLTDVSGVFKIG